MSARTLSHYEIVSQLPVATVITFHNVSWREYERLLDQVGEASGLRLSYNNGRLQVMTLSSEHENYVRFIESLMTTIKLRLRINIRSFGSATMKQRKQSKGKEPDACFYVQSAEKIGLRTRLDFTKDPPPDIAVEVDIHHDSQADFPIYAALGVPEVWRYDGEGLIIHCLQSGNYVPSDTSPALPFLTAARLTDHLRRLSTEGEFQALVTFDQWLQTQQA